MKELSGTGGTVQPEDTTTERKKRKDIRENELFLWQQSRKIGSSEAVR